MGADCCSGGQDLHHGPSSGSYPNGDHHGRNDLAELQGDNVICCDDGTCADEEKVDADYACGKSDESSLHSEATTCCGSEERCDGELSALGSEGSA